MGRPRRHCLLLRMRISHPFQIVQSGKSGRELPAISKQDARARKLNDFYLTLAAKHSGPFFITKRHKNR